MSHTTHILLHVAPDDNHHATELAFWIRTDAPRTDTRTESSPGHLAPLTGELAGEAWGGPKNPTAILWAGTTDHVDLDALLGHILAVPWNHPDAVQIMVKDEADPYFRLYMIRESTISQYSPAPPAEDQETPW